MKIVNVNNLSLQFDTEEEVTEELIESYIELLNVTLSDIHLNSQPQIVKEDNLEFEVINIGEI